MDKSLTYEAMCMFGELGSILDVEAQVVHLGRVGFVYLVPEHSEDDPVLQPNGDVLFGCYCHHGTAYR